MSGRSIVNWLRIFRSHTCPATMMLVMIFYLLGGGELFSLFGLLVLVFSILIHWFSFGNNTLMDTAMGYDTKDKHKQHHPLISGKISLESAHKVIHTGIVILTFLGIWIALNSGGNPLYAIMFFMIFIVTGFAYNNGLSKVTIFGFIPITLSFTSLTLYAYYLCDSEMSELVLLCVLYMAWTLLFQISYSGHLKEIETVGENLLRHFGARAGNGHFYPGYAYIWGWGVKITNLAIGISIIYRYVRNPIITAMAMLMIILMVHFCLRLTKSQRWNRNKTLVDMAVMEILTIYMLPIMLIPILGLVEMITLMALGILLFISLNRLCWGTRLRPQV